MAIRWEDLDVEVSPDTLVETADTLGLDPISLARTGGITTEAAHKLRLEETGSHTTDIHELDAVEERPLFANDNVIEMAMREDAQEIDAILERYGVRTVEDLLALLEDPDLSAAHAFFQTGVSITES